MKKDIETIEDIKQMIDSFYDKVKVDKVIGFIFNDVVRVNWEIHLPVMYKFWENSLFYSGSYEGNPLALHKHIHQLTALNALHFNQWVSLFNTTVDELFEGPISKLAKQRALSISTVLQIKILS